ncbi:hypothetical protein BJX70DRAFT_136921 [Aspergillus crustosus]
MDLQDESESPDPVDLTDYGAESGLSNTVFTSPIFDNAFHAARFVSSPLLDHFEQLPMSNDPFMSPLTVTAPSNTADMVHFTPPGTDFKGQDNVIPNLARFAPAMHPSSAVPPHLWHPTSESFEQHGKVSQPLARYFETWNQCFSRMSSELLEDLNLLELGMVVCNIQLSTPSTYMTVPIDPTYARGSGHYIVGQLLRRAEEFLCALKALRGQPRARDSLPLVTDLLCCQALQESRAGTPAEAGRESHRMTTSQTSAFDYTEATADQAAQPIHSLLALLITTCHATLLRTCHGVVSLIRDYLIAAKAGASFEPVLPTIQLDGHDIEWRQELQVDIFVQVVCHLLDQIGDTLRRIAVRGKLHAGLDELLGARSQVVDGESSCDAQITQDSIIRACQSIHAYLGGGEDLC